ncbi:hypothetical protein [Scatolibacter rhodanostii]|uniref:hypothetical protein n=1 Tax=Scatolibacter rhodanostii TaxID=2014781 RepID=UPI000C07D54B|nr:hypothetical protein [Scatolibacter rhodanostii]
MPDILRVTTPLVHNNQPVQQKSGVDPLFPSDIRSSSRVVQAQNQSELLKQNTGALEGGEAPVLLLNLLKDPAVTISYLKNISMLEEIFRLLPANNQTVTPEIEQIFQELILPSTDIESEILRQESGATAFKGELFDFLRAFSVQREATPQVQVAIANFLKSVNNLLCKGDIEDAVANSLTYLKNQLSSSTSISTRLDSLIARFRQNNASQNFTDLKEETLSLLKEIENSVLFTPKLSKVLSITIYNLSRHNVSWDFFNESSYHLRQFLAGTQRQQFISLVDRFASALKSGVYDSNILSHDETMNHDSKVMEALVKLIGIQSSNDRLSASDSSKIDKILHSLLSSPCNFTPLLHFIIPVIHEDIRAFAEIWINPESDEKDLPNGAKEGKHFLLVIDVDNLGRFEAELFVYGTTIDFSLFCPPDYEKEFQGMMKNMPKALADSPFRIGETKLAPLERSRSLMEVFKSLPYKRVGVDVKI